MKGKKEMPKQPPVFKTDEEKVAYLQKLADYYGVEANFNKSEETSPYYLIKNAEPWEIFEYRESLQEALYEFTAAAQNITGVDLEDKLNQEQKELIEKYTFKNYFDLPPEEVNFNSVKEADDFVKYLYKKAKELNDWKEKQLKIN